MLKHLSLHIFNANTRIIWLVLASVTIISELIPTPHVRPLLFYGLYGPAKIACFLSLGFVTPLSFAILSGLNKGIGFAVISAILFEVLQVMIGNGHRFHWYELLVKLGMVIIGFTLGLDARVMREIEIGSVHITLIPDDR